ncbi:unnamed protein product [Vitrella brassicaformis CCMP3155]|uniref:Uncharacterized protein n=1 Tax=Vitrella brassicaformis (strain CCMP3155) TaxID=1169540 RepID=A0A0G4GK22_VITBC|nr:unnamed protein product [Vitrella brassicaformis CCMP3155]|eukprot:CEM30255.1 unnamed protein product [Vitrella brassicaformis CCMP3155]
MRARGDARSLPRRHAQTGQATAAVPADIDDDGSMGSYDDFTKSFPEDVFLLDVDQDNLDSRPRHATPEAAAFPQLPTLLLHALRNLKSISTAEHWATTGALPSPLPPPSQSTPPPTPFPGPKHRNPLFWADFDYADTTETGKSAIPPEHLTQTSIVEELLASPQSAAKAELEGMILERLSEQASSDLLLYQDARPEQQQDLAAAAKQPQDDTRALPDVPVQPTGTQRTSLLPSPAVSLAHSTIPPTQSSSLLDEHQLPMRPAAHAPSCPCASSADPPFLLLPSSLRTLPRPQLTGDSRDRRDESHDNTKLMLPDAIPREHRYGRVLSPCARDSSTDASDDRQSGGQTDDSGSKDQGAAGMGGGFGASAAKAELEGMILERLSEQASSDLLLYQDARPEQQQDLAAAAKQPQDDTRALPDVPVPATSQTTTLTSFATKMPAQSNSRTSRLRQSSHKTTPGRCSDVPVPQVQPTGTQRTSLLPSPALSLAHSTIPPNQSSSLLDEHQLPMRLAAHAPSCPCASSADPPFLLLPSSLRPLPRPQLTGDSRDRRDESHDNTKLMLPDAIPRDHRYGRVLSPCARDSSTDASDDRQSGGQTDDSGSKDQGAAGMGGGFGAVHIWPRQPWRVGREQPGEPQRHGGERQQCSGGHEE